jgi:very-short-patch-repair endonuclease
MVRRQTLTPTLSRMREREEQPIAVSGPLSRMREREGQPIAVSGPLSRKQEREQQPIAVSDSLSRLRERVRVRARELRDNQTDAEGLLWSKLRNRQMLGLKFRRQRPVGIYFADFACLEIGLIIELDRGQHSETPAKEYDAAWRRPRRNGFSRAAFLEQPSAHRDRRCPPEDPRDRAYPHPNPLPQAGEGVKNIDKEFL